MVFRVLYNGGIHRRGKFILASVIRSAISAVAPGDNATTELRNLPIQHLHSIPYYHHYISFGMCNLKDMTQLYTVEDSRPYAAFLSLLFLACNTAKSPHSVSKFLLALPVFVPVYRWGARAIEKVHKTKERRDDRKGRGRRAAGVT